ncbi:MAG: DUF4239 domain-containing protein [Anaerolineales bacterium]|nr:DUF4239 domain-containing protein [Anaerolineales bacterium]
MTLVILRSFFFAILSGLAYYLARVYLHTEMYIDDVDGISAFLGVFGTLYGILAAFVVFEVWTQYNKISELIDREAQALEQLFRLSLYFRDANFTERMKAGIREYVSKIVEGNFRALAKGERNAQSGLALRKISHIIRDVDFNDDHDSIVFEQVVEHYGMLAELRTERTNQSRNRLPRLLKTFIYLSTGFALATFLFMPFSNEYYGLASVVMIAFLQAMIFQIIEDLDNPFSGHWQLTPAPFTRALKHIEEDYD